MAFKTAGRLYKVLCTWIKVSFICILISSVLRLRCGFCRIEVYTVWGGIRNYETLSVESGTVIVFIREENSLLFLLLFVCVCVCVLCFYFDSFFFFFSKARYQFTKALRSGTHWKVSQISYILFKFLFCSFRWRLKRCSLYVLIEKPYDIAHDARYFYKGFVLWDHDHEEEKSVK